MWVAAAAWTALSARDSAVSAIDELRRVEPQVGSELSSFVGLVGAADEARPDPLAALRAARADLADAADDLRSPVLAPVRVMPVLGRQLRAVQDLTDAAERTSAATATSLETLRGILDEAGSDPASRLAATERSQQVLSQLSGTLADIGPGSERALLGAVRDARQRFGGQLDDLREAVDRATTTVAGVNALLRGPNRYLVFAANSAEMRAGSGMYLQAAELDLVDGTMTLGDFSFTGDLYLDAPGATLDPDVERVWGALRPAQEWRNLNLTPRFDATARMAADMWVAAGGAPVDGVMALDIIALRELLRTLGPVEVTDERGTFVAEAETIAQELLLQQYFDFPDDRDARRDRLGRVAEAVFAAFNERDVPPVALIRAIEEAARGRHLLAWSSDPTQQAAWEELGASGEVPADALMLSVLNRGGNKLDQFLELAAEMRVERSGGGERRMTVEVDVANGAPEGLPSYVAGPFPGSGLAAGEYRGLLALTVPGAAHDVEVAGGELLSAAPDGEAGVVVVPLSLPRGATAVVEISFDLPDAVESVRVLSSSRVPAVEWSAGAESWPDGRPRVVRLEPLEPSETGE